MATLAPTSYTFVPPSYTYVPTAPRSKSAAARGKPASSIPDKLHRSKLSGPALDSPRLPATAVADNDGGYRSGIQAETGTFYSDSDNPHTIEEILYTPLQQKCFAMEDQRPDNTAFRVEEAIAEERGGFIDHNESAPSDNSGRSPEDPIVQQGDENSSASEAKVDDNGLRAESAAIDVGLFDTLETAIDSTILPPSSNPDGGQDIDDFPETPRLRLAKQGASTFNSMRPHASSSHATSEPLNEVTMSHPAGPRQSPDHLPTDRNAVDEHELVRTALNSDIFEQDTQRQEDENYDNDIEDGNQPQQEVKEDVATALMTGKVGDTHLSSGKDESLGLATCDPPPKPSEDKLGSYGNRWTDNELNNNSESDDDDRRPSPAKRKRLSSSNNVPKQKKRKHHLEQKSTHQHRPRSKLHQHYRKSHSSLDQGSRVVAVASSGEGQFPSPTPSAPQTTDTETTSDCSNLGGSSGDLLPTLTEVTFRPYSQHCCSFTAVVQDSCDKRGVSFSQLAQLIKSIGYVGKIDDFTIKPLQQNSFLVTGFSRHPSSQLSSGTILATAAEADPILDDPSSTILQHNRAINTRTVTQRGSEPASSDDDSGLSDSGSDPSSDDDGCCSEDEQKLSSTKKNIRWESIDEQRLLAYWKEGKPWKWIFKKFPTRTPQAVRTRLNMLRPRGE